jgi:hypothetical protein
VDAHDDTLLDIVAALKPDMRNSTAANRRTVASRCTRFGLPVKRCPCGAEDLSQTRQYAQSWTD